MKTTTKTPGYNCRMTIAFTTNKRGTRIAYYYSGRCFGFGRWIRLGLAVAEDMQAQETADVVPYTRSGSDIIRNGL